jgi:hypothetical protein
MEPIPDPLAIASQSPAWQKHERRFLILSMIPSLVQDTAHIGLLRSSRPKSLRISSAVGISDHAQANSTTLSGELSPVFFLVFPCPFFPLERALVYVPNCFPILVLMVLVHNDDSPSRSVTCACRSHPRISPPPAIASIGSRQMPRKHPLYVRVWWYLV